LAKYVFQENDGVWELKDVLSRESRYRDVRGLLRAVVEKPED
jgi:hypothetical protein